MPVVLLAQVGTSDTLPTPNTAGSKPNLFLCLVYAWNRGWWQQVVTIPTPIPYPPYRLPLCPRAAENPSWEDREAAEDKSELSPWHMLHVPLDFIYKTYIQK